MMWFVCADVPGGKSGMTMCTNAIFGSCKKCLRIGWLIVKYIYQENTLLFLLNLFPEEFFKLSKSFWHCSNTFWWPWLAFVAVVGPNLPRNVVMVVLWDLFPQIRFKDFDRREIWTSEKFVSKSFGVGFGRTSGRGDMSNFRLDWALCCSTLFL